MLEPFDKSKEAPYFIRIPNDMGHQGMQMIINCNTAEQVDFIMGFLINDGEDSESHPDVIYIPGGADATQAKTEN